MSEVPSASSTDEAVQQTRVRPRRMGVRSLLILVATCAAMLWAYRYLSENYDPLSVEFRAIRERSITALRSGTHPEKLTAIDALARLPNEDKSFAMPVLIETMDDSDRNVSLAAVELLQQIIESVAYSPLAELALPATEAALIRRLKLPDATFRVEAHGMLGSIADGLLAAQRTGKLLDDAIATLVSSLRDEDPRVREVAATRLGSIAAPQWRASAEGVPSMIMPSIDRKAVMDAIAPCLDDDDAGVRRAAIIALARNPNESGEPPALLMKGFKDESVDNRLTTIFRFHNFAKGLDPFVKQLFQLLEEDTDPRIQEECSNTLSLPYSFKPPAITSKLIPFLITSLGSKSVQIRSHAASLLGRFGRDAEEAVVPLLKLSKEPLEPKATAVMGLARTIFDPGCAAALSLGSIAPETEKAKEVFTALMELMRSGPASRRAFAAIALGGFGGFGASAEEAVPILIQVIKDAPPEGMTEREAAAAVALGQIAPGTHSAGKAIDALLPLLQPNAPLIGQKAIEAVANFGPQAIAAIPRLRELERADDAQTNSAATKALRAIEKQ